MSRFTKTHQSGVTVLRVGCANFDASVTGSFLKAVGEIVGERPSVVVDLSAVEFVDSSGLGALCTLARHVKPHPVRLAGASARLMARLGAMFGEKPRECHETLDDAIAAFRPSEVIECENRTRTNRYAEHAELV